MYPNIDLFELTETVVLIIPKAGTINMYTSGCPKNPIPYSKPFFTL